MRLLQFFPVERGVKGLGYRIVSFLKLGYHLKSFVISLRLRKCPVGIDSWYRDVEKAGLAELL